ncbi:hypothetical protein D3C77_161240 [compost metagenome]
MVGARAEHRPVQAAEQVGLAVVAQAAAMGVDQLYGVVDPAVFGQLGITVGNGDTIALGDLHHGHGRRPVFGLGQARHGFAADVVAGQEHFRAHQ